MKQREKAPTHFLAEEKIPSEDRLVMLCDGIFAIALTLLALDIGIKITSPHPTQEQVNAALLTLIPPAVSYLVTFVIIAFYWRFHRNLMQVVQHLDNAFISLTFLFLAFIAFFPATSNLLGNYADDPAVVVLYTLGLSGCGFSALALWLYATWNHRLVAPDLSTAEINTRTYSLLLNPLVYCSSLLLLLVVPEPYYICYSWALIGFTHRIVQNIYKRWLEKPVQALIHQDRSTLDAQLVEEPACETKEHTV